MASLPPARTKFSFTCCQHGCRSLNLCHFMEKILILFSNHKWRRRKRPYASEKIIILESRPAIADFHDVIRHSVEPPKASFLWSVWPSGAARWSMQTLTAGKENPRPGCWFWRSLCWEPPLSTIVSWFGSRGPNGRPIWRRDRRRLRLSVTPGHSVQRIYSKPG